VEPRAVKSHGAPICIGSRREEGNKKALLQSEGEVVKERPKVSLK